MKNYLKWQPTWGRIQISFGTRQKIRGRWKLEKFLSTVVGGGGVGDGGVSNGDDGGGSGDGGSYGVYLAVIGAVKVLV